MIERFLPPGATLMLRVVHSRRAGLLLLVVIAVAAFPPAVVADDALPFGARVRLGTTAFRHDSYRQSAAFSADGKVLASVGEQQGVYLWETASGRRLQMLDYPATCVAMSQSGSALAIGIYSRQGEGAV